LLKIFFQAVGKGLAEVGRSQIRVIKKIFYLDGFGSSSCPGKRIAYATLNGG
jgi:hypothetical protein